MREDKQEYSCEIVNISPGGMAVLAPIEGNAGERIVVYLEQLGRIEGELTRTFPGGFALRIKATPYKREKIANQLTWLLNKDNLNLAEDRQYERITPRNPVTKMALPDGSVRNCRVLDVSLGGAAVSVHPKPELGDIVTLGLTRGRVVRHNGHGIGIEFLEIQDPATIERLFG